MGKNLNPGVSVCACLATGHVHRRTAMNAAQYKSQTYFKNYEICALGWEDVVTQLHHCKQELCR